jgi:hypothetical protein
MCILIACDLAQYLYTDGVNMLERNIRTVKDINNKITTQHIICIEDETRKKLIGSDKIVYTRASKLPMIVKPKPYILHSDSKRISGGVITLLYTKICL